MKALDRVPGRHAAGGGTFAFFLLLALPTTAVSQQAEFGALTGQPFVRTTGDVLGYELVPSFNGSYRGAPFSTNRWGMRDRNYDSKAPPGTYRIALVGSSFTMGGGVRNDETMEWLLEERLNNERPDPPRRRYEILNFSVGGYGILQEMVVTERKVFPFAPNAVLLVVHSSEARRMTQYLAGLVRAGVPIKYPYVREKLQQAGVRPDMEQPELRRRLNPIADDLVRWSYQRIADMCREHGAHVVGILFPEPMPRRGDDLAKVSRSASAAGIPLLSLDGAYAGHPLDSVRLPEGVHLSVLGHKLVAERLYRALHADHAVAVKFGFAGRSDQGNPRLDQ